MNDYDEIHEFCDVGFCDVSFCHPAPAAPGRQRHLRVHDKDKKPGVVDSSATRGARDDKSRV